MVWLVNLMERERRFHWCTRAPIEFDGDVAKETSFKVVLNLRDDI